MKIKVRCPECDYENKKNLRLKNGINHFICSQCISTIYIVIKNNRVENITSKKQKENARNPYFSSSSIVRI